MHSNTSTNGSLGSCRLTRICGHNHYEYLGLFMQDTYSIFSAFPGGLRLNASQNATEKQSFCIYLELNCDNAG